LAASPAVGGGRRLGEERRMLLRGREEREE
jgi:hypothetical protein